MRIGMAKYALGNAPYCGDECAYWQEADKTMLCMADGLGHGEHAEIAAKSAIEYVADHASEPLLDIFKGCDKAIRHTRGAAMGICLIEETSQTLTFSGISNTRTMIFGKTTRNMSSNFGIVGAGYRKLVTETVSIETGDLVVMFTDGLPETIDLKAYDYALRHDVPKLAQHILRDFRSGSDDAAVLVHKCR